METQNKKDPKKPDLLEIPDPERTKLIQEIRAKLRQSAEEEKLWQSLLQVESLTVNGNMVYRQDEQLSGFYFDNKI